MNNKMSAFIGFVIGGCVGILASRQFFKTKYEKITDEAVESVKKVFGRDAATLEAARQKAAQAKNKPDLDDLVEDTGEPKNIYKMMSSVNTQKTDYTKFSQTPEEQAAKEEGIEVHEEEPMNPEALPHVITPDEFSQEDDYGTVTYTYYSDGVMTDENDNPISKDTIKQNVGERAVTHFGEYEEDSVFVRNDALHIDFEILKDSRDYSESHTVHMRRPDDIGE